MTPTTQPLLSNKNRDTAAPRSRRVILWLDFVLPALILGLGTWLIRAEGLDLRLQRAFFETPGSWEGKGVPLLDFLYKFGTLPALIVSLTGLAVFIVSFFSSQVAIWRRSGLFLVLAMALGPGLLVNSVFKQNWGRPRPRNVVEFNGQHAFEEPLEMDPSSPGNSFPSGHASMGFYFFALYFVVRGRKKRLTPWMFGLGLIYGIGMGIMRMAQGGHFASDVLWSGGFVYLSCALVYYLLKLEKVAHGGPPAAEVV